MNNFTVIANDELIEKLLRKLRIQYDGEDKLGSYITIQKEWEYSIDRFTGEMKKTDVYVLYIAKEELYQMPQEFKSIKKMEAFIDYLLTEGE